LEEEEEDAEIQSNVEEQKMDTSMKGDGASVAEKSDAAEAEPIIEDC